MNEFVVFQSFFSEEEAKPIAEILKANGIEYKIVKPKILLDHTFVGEDLDNKIFLKIRSSDFPKANEILDELIEKNIASIGPDYYLYSFTNSELQEIIHKPDEWSRQDFIIARKILGERGEHVSAEEIKKIKSDRLKQLSIEESEESSWIFFGYVLALGGIIGFFWGMAFAIAKKNLPNGGRMFRYNKKIRDHGKLIAIISLMIIILNIILNENIRAAFLGLFGLGF